MQASVHLNSFLDGDGNQLEQNADTPFRFGTSTTGGDPEHDENDDQGNIAGFGMNPENHSGSNTEAKQEDIMRTVGVRALDRVLKGYNGAVLCYGQSGSGKTHTMIGSGGGKEEQLDFDPLEQDGENGWDEGIGLLPRMLHTLFVDLEKKHGSMKGKAETPDEGSEEPFWSVEVSAVELYNEELRDLLTAVVPSSASATKPSRQSFRASAARESVSRPETTVLFQDDPDEPTPSKPSISKRHSVANASASNSRRQSFARRQSLTSAGGSMPPVPPTPPLRILQTAPSSESTGMSVYVEGLSRHRVMRFSEALTLVRQALHERKMGETRLNARSNRSHTIFFVYVHQRELAKVKAASPSASQEMGSADGLVQVKRSVLTLVDLAGSERVSQTGAEGQQLVEAQRINLSLTLLGNVIRRLTARMVHSHAHIPYRDSKLTRLLQDCFGGNAVTYLLCTLSPEDTNRSESLSTLRFAQLAKKVKNKATMNTSIASGSVEEQLRQAFDYIAWLENQLKLIVSRADQSVSSSLPEAQQQSVNAGDGSVPPSADIIFIRSLLPPQPGRGSSHGATPMSRERSQRRVSESKSADAEEDEQEEEEGEASASAAREQTITAVKARSTSGSNSRRRSCGSAIPPLGIEEEDDEGRPTVMLQEQGGTHGSEERTGSKEEEAEGEPEPEPPLPVEEDAEVLEELPLNGDGEAATAVGDTDAKKELRTESDDKEDRASHSAPSEAHLSSHRSSEEVKNVEEANEAHQPDLEESPAAEAQAEEEAKDGHRAQQDNSDSRNASSSSSSSVPPSEQPSPSPILHFPSLPDKDSDEIPAGGGGGEANAPAPAADATAPAEVPPPMGSQPMPHVPPFDLEDEITPRHFLQSYGHCTPIGAATEAYRFHPLSTPSLITAPLHPLTHSSTASMEEWEEPDMDEFSTKKLGGSLGGLPAVHQKVKKGALQRMMDAMRLAAAIATTADEPNY